MNIMVRFRERLEKTIVDELDNLIAKLKVWGEREHHEDGTHGAVTADSLAVAGDATIGGNVSAGEGINTLGEFTFSDDGTEQSLQIGPDDTGWVIGRKAASSPLSGFSFFIRDLLNSAFSVLEIGFISGLDTYFVLPHDQKGTALGYKDGSSSDRFDYLAVQDGMYEQGRSAAAGYPVTAPYNAGNFTAQAGAWGVDDGDEEVTYTITGKQMTVYFQILNTDVSATPGFLRMVIPGGYTSAITTRNCISTIDNGGVPQFGMALSVAGDTGLYFYRDATGGSTTWSTTAGDNTNVAGQITFPIQ